MAFSFAGTSAAEQDSMRGAGRFDRAAALAALFAGCRPSSHPPVLMIFLLMESNRHALPHLLGFAKRMGVSRVEVGHFNPGVLPTEAAWPGLSSD